MKVGEIWVPKGHTSEWKIWVIGNDNMVGLTRIDILNPGWGTSRYSKIISKEALLKYYKKSNIMED